MPVVAALLKSLLLSLVDDALRIIVPLLLGLGLLALLFGQAVAGNSLATPDSRVELLRPLVIAVSLRTGTVIDDQGEVTIEGGVPAHLLLAIAEVFGDFDPLRNCRAASPEARRGLLGVRPSEYRSRDLLLTRYFGSAAAHQARGVCDPEANIVVAASRLGRYYVARQSEFIFENQDYRQALDEHARQKGAYERCLAERAAAAGEAPSGAEAPIGEAPPCRGPDDRLLIPPPACIERHGDPNPRSPSRPEHKADWEDKETLCRILDRYHDGLSFPRVWAARAAWRERLARPLAARRPPSPEAAIEAPGGSVGYAVGEALRYARAQLGQPYVWGGANPRDGFDCSGLVQWAYGQAGLRLPRTAEEQYRATTRVAYDQLQPGDLVFFCCDPSQPQTRVSHVGIYVGGGQMLDAPAPGKPVRVEPIWLSDYVGGGRIRPPSTAGGVR